MNSSVAYDGCFHYPHDRNVVYICKAAKTGQKVGGKDLLLCFGRFSSADAGRRAEVVRWRPAIDDDVRARLLRYLSAKSKKRPAAAISPSEEGDGRENGGGRASRRPLVAIQPPPTDRPPLVLYYVIGGRAGKYIIPANAQAVDIQRLREHLLPISREKENSERASKKVYAVQETASVSYWVPNGIIGVAKCEITRLQKRSNIIDKWLALFSGKQCKQRF